MSLAKLSHLRTMSIEDLRLLWSKLYQMPSQSNSREFLIKRLTYRLQELSSKNSDCKDVADRLDALAARNCARDVKESAVPLGTVLVRQYHGVEHQVASIVGGFEYNGCKFRSLSAIAKLITGMSWSGNAFFGLPKSYKRVKR